MTTNKNEEEIYTVREYGYLWRASSRNKKSSTFDDCWIPEAMFDALEAMVLDDDSDGTKGVIYSASKGSGGTPRLKVRNYIGAIGTKAGVLEILPKIASNTTNIDELRKIVTRMLETVFAIPFKQIGPAGQDKHEEHLFEWFLAAFLNQIKKLVSRGLRSAYELKEDNLSTLRGRLLMTKHLRINASDASHLYVQFDEFTFNRAENRIIHAALDKVWRTSQSDANRRLARELMISFSDIDISRNTNADFLAWRNERGTSHYSGIDSWCRAVLRNYSTAPISGQLVFDSFLFPAEKLFEAYIAEKMRKSFTNGEIFDFKTQVSGKSLFKNQGGPFDKNYSLRPDIVITRKNKELNEVLICDTKWKIYDDTNAQVSQADLYQLFAYANYWEENSHQVHLALIAPMSSKLSEPTFHNYAVPGNDQRKYSLSMRPFNLLNDEFVKFKKDKELWNDMTSQQ